MTQPGKPQPLARITGIDNISDEREMRAGSARELVNLDLTPKGMPKTRAGFVAVDTLAGDEAHSLTDWTGGMVAVLDGNLIAFTDDEVPTTLRSGMGAYPERALTYAELNGDLYWSDGADFRRIRGADMVDTEGWPDIYGQPRLTPVVGTGGLTAGTYQVALTVRDADGRESGSTLAELVDVVEGGGIQLTGFPAASPEATTYRIYLSPPNGDILEWHRDVPINSTLILVGAARRTEKPLETQFLMPLPPGHLLAASGARLLMAVENEIAIGEAYRYGLMQPDRRVAFPSRITLLQPCGEAGEAGVFVCGSDRTLWWSGFDAASMTRRVVRPAGAVLGSGLTVPGTLLGLETTAPCAFWLGTDGVFCAGLPSGTVIPLTEGQVALPSAERAAGLIRERNGLRQILMALQGQVVDSPLAASDSAVAEVRRRGVLIS